jgi:hypothetical protein
VGVVTRGVSVAPSDRSVISISFNPPGVTRGTSTAAKNAGGKFKDVKSLGKVNIPTWNDLDIEDWVKQIVVSEEERDFQTVIKEIKEIMAGSNRQNHDDSMQLEVFSGMIVSQRDVGFVQNNPSLNQLAALSWFT